MDTETEVRGLLRQEDGTFLLAPGWHNIALITEYDGSRFAGWQRQEAHIRTVQGVLEAALEKICGHPITLYASSRTDGGVHALGHVSNFRTDCRIPVDRIPLAAATKLPMDLVVKEAFEVDGAFNARYHAQSKTYSYYIWNARRPSAIYSRYSSHVPTYLNIGAMQAAAGGLIGVHDFSAFKAEGGQTKTTVREIFKAEVELIGEGSGDRRHLLFPTAHDSESRFIRITVTGSGFLYNMMRIIAGTLLYIGQGKIAADQIPVILASRDRLTAGKTMPPEGLILTEVDYGDWLGGQKNG